MTMLEVKGISAAYGQHVALKDVSLRVRPGEIVVILGANGAGKSTLLKAVSGICEGRVTGSVTLQSAELLGLPAHRIVEEGIALVPEGRGVFGDLTVAENLTLGAHAPRAREEEAGSLDRVLRLFPKLAERRGQVVRTMSGGEQQMVAIGRAMMSNPGLLTLDEPSLGLSPLLCKELFQSLLAVKAAGIGVLLVEQNARQSLAIADRAYLLENGGIVQEGRAEDLRSDPAVQAAYLGGPKTGKGPSTAPQPMPQPMLPAERPRKTGPAPADIAAAALAALAPQTARPEPALPPPAAALQPPALPPPPTPAASDTPLGGQSLADLVDRAAKASRAAYGSSRLAPPPLPPLMPVPPRLTTSTANDADRLKSVLTEIEEAAARARSWRPDPNRKPGS
jgi:branched-chain amino acid transport system ATP-binding protein